MANCFDEYIDYVASSISSNDSIGLFNGRIGIALSLFESLKYAPSDDIEDRVFEIIQNSLLYETNDISLENGLSGIGWALLYFIENGFLDNDFEELFEKQYCNIMDSINKYLTKPLAMLHNFRCVYFLYDAKKHKPLDDRLDYYIQKLFESVEIYLLVQFKDFNNPDFIGNKSKLLEVFEAYLQAVNYTKYKFCSFVLLDYYFDMLSEDDCIKSYKIGYYIANTKGYLNDRADLLLSKINADCLNSDCVKLCSLSERIDLLKIVDKNSDYFKLLSDSLINLTLKDSLSLVSDGDNKSSYSKGVSRLLVFLTNNNAILI